MNPHKAKLIVSTNDDNLADLAITANNNPRLVLHNFKTFGGGKLFYIQTYKFYCSLINSGHVAQSIIVDKWLLLSHIDIMTSMYIVIISFLGPQEIKAISCPNQVDGDPTNLRCSSSFLVPAPWLLQATLDAILDDPASILLKTNDMAKMSFTTILKQISNISQRQRNNKYKLQGGCGQL